jgi:hypothetical protein
MTWVVGASSIFGYGVIISDVRISWLNGADADMLRKAYPVGPYILAGLAGSVRIGMHLVASLQHFLDRPETRTEAQVAWKPEWVAENWSPLAAKLFAQAPVEEQECGSQIILVGVSPGEDMGVPEFRRVYVVKFSWPDFTPTYSGKGFTVSHIGSGSGNDSFTAAISEHFRLEAPSLQAEMGGLNGWSQMLGHSVGGLVARNPIPGISPLVNIDTCRLGGFYSGNNNETVHYPDGRTVEIRMPKIASTYAEFVSMCEGLGMNATGAIA